MSFLRFASSLALCGALLSPTSVLAQDSGAKLPTAEDFAKDNKLFINFARKALKWDEPVEPFKIAGALHYVGTRGLSSYLFATSEGLILHNTGMPESCELIADSIRKLGFDPKDIKIMINGHGHSDHAGAFACIKKMSGAQVAVMEAEVPLLESGGKTDFHYGKDWKIMGQPPVEVDRILHDLDTVQLGEIVLTAHHTPGHTRGATTWMTTVTDNGRAYNVIFVDGAGFNPGYRVSVNMSYPGMEKDYRNTLHFLELQTPDIALGPHAEWFKNLEKQQKAKSDGVKAWVNPEEYRQWVADKRRAFEDQVDREHGVPAN